MSAPCSTGRKVGGERAWADWWDGEWLNPTVDKTEPGTVFTTAHAGRRTTWTVVRREGSASIGCSSTTSGERREDTTVTVSYHLTAQPPDANLALRDFAAHFRPFLELWQDSIARSLAGNQPPSALSCTVPGRSSSKAQLPSRSPERAGYSFKMDTPKVA